MKRLLAASRISEHEIFSDAEFVDEALSGLTGVCLRAEWQRSLRAACGDFLRWIDVQDLVCRWNADVRPDDVRLIFSFDS